MKKISFLIVLLCAAVSLQAAKVGFLLANTEKAYSAITNVYDEAETLPLDAYNDGENHEQSPERKAYEWFKGTYSATKSFYTIHDVEQGRLLSDGKPVIDVLWFNMDRKRDVNDIITTYLNRSTFKTALANYVKAGGNLVLTKQAGRMVYETGRCDVLPSWNDGTYDNVSTNNYGVQEMGTSSYKVFSDLTFTSFKTPLSTIPYRAFRECVWTHADDAARAAFEDQESGQDCKILGVDGDSFNKTGFVEFYPHGDYKGTILVMGLLSYEWGDDNSLKANVQKLTQNMLDYLSPSPNVQWATGASLTAGTIGYSDALTATANDGYSVAITSSDDNIGSYSDGAAHWNYFGDVTFTATATPNNADKGIKIPKNAPSGSIDKSITVSGGSSSATIGYVLTSGQHLNLANESGDIPNPDKAAAQWFHTNYVATSQGQFINPSNAIPDAVQTLWIHSDRKDLGSESYMTELGGTFVSKLRTYLAAGKNLFVSKQATRLIGDLQRLGNGLYPTYGASSGGADSWDYGEHGPYVIGNNFTTPVSEEHSTHAIYQNLGPNPTLITAGTHTNRNYVININDWAGLTTHEDFDTYQTTHDCRLLGDWGNYPQKYECGGLVEFYPKNGVGEGDYTFNQVGTIMMLGLAAYQWVNPTDNTRTLTSNILSYLNTTSAPAIDWVTAPVDGEVGESQNVAVTFADGPVWWSMDPDDGTVSIDVDTNHPIESEYKLMTLNQAGTVTITASRSGDGYALPRNVTPTSISKTINVATNIYTRSVTSGNYGTICLPRASAALEGATFFKVLGKEMSGETPLGVYIEEVYALEAGKPYIFEASAEEISVTYTGPAVSAPDNSDEYYGLIGSFYRTLIPDNEGSDFRCILKDNKIRKVNHSYVGANRAYFDLGTMRVYDDSQPVMGRRRFMGIDRPSMPTEVENAEAVKIESRKVIENGQLFIIKNGVKYNAQGQIVR